MGHRRRPTRGSSTLRRPQIPGFVSPVAYSVVRLEEGQLTFGHVNDRSSEHRPPAVVLASFGGYTSRTGTFNLNREDFSRAVAALAAAEAATYWEHPDLWSWRRLLEQAGPQSIFIAFHPTDLTDPVVDEHDDAFRSRLSAAEQNSSAGDYGRPTSRRS